MDRGVSSSIHVMMYDGISFQGQSLHVTTAVQYFYWNHWNFFNSSNQKVKCQKRTLPNRCCTTAVTATQRQAKFFISLCCWFIESRQMVGQATCCLYMRPPFINSYLLANTKKAFLFKWQLLLAGISCYILQLQLLTPFRKISKLK